MRPEIRRYLPAIALLSTMIVASPAAAAAVVPAAGKDFRAAAWGQSRQQVRAQEQALAIIDTGPLLAFPATVAGHPCQVIYLFTDDELCMGFYQWSDTHADLSPYFADATARRDELAAAWGEPRIERWDWDDPMFANEPSLRAEALGLGLARYELGWLTDRSLIALRLSGGSLKADLVLMYADQTCFPVGQESFAHFFASTIGLPTPYYR